MPVLSRLRGHGDLDVQVLALPGLVPPVDLQVHPEWQPHVDHVQLLPLAALLQDLPRAVRSHPDQRVLVGELVREAGDDRRLVERGAERRDAQDVLGAVGAVHERATYGHLLHDGEAVRDRGGHVAALYPNRVALDHPILALGIKAGVAAVERSHVRVPEDPAGARDARGRGGGGDRRKCWSGRRGGRQYGRRGRFSRRGGTRRLGRRRGRRSRRHGGLLGRGGGYG
mmetsp:Transcript_60962/g.164384  ORF Transcript_60962/g.164384 Transcript_60962/m.164384 type:complete len:227 (+) Transcript_60962:573-1253(+)